MSQTAAAGGGGGGGGGGGFDENAATARLLEVNAWIVHARVAKPELLRRLATAREQAAGTGRGGRATAEADVVAAWAAMVGSVQRRHDGAAVETAGGPCRSLPFKRRCHPHSTYSCCNWGVCAAEGDDEGEQLDALLLIIGEGGAVTSNEGGGGGSMESAVSAVDTRVRLRRVLVAAALADRRSQADASLLQRSEVLTLPSAGSRTSDSLRWR